MKGKRCAVLVIREVDIHTPGEGDLFGHLPDIAGASRVKQLHNTSTSSYQYLYHRQSHTTHTTKIVVDVKTAHQILRLRHPVQREERGGELSMGSGTAFGWIPYSAHNTQPGH